MPSLALPSIVPQQSTARAYRARLLSNRPFVSDAEDVDDTDTLELHSLTSSTSHSHSCDSCSHLEADFAGAVLFVKSYQGPHRILSQENSSPKKDMYAYYQQATAGPLLALTPPVGLNKHELAKWEKWRELGNMTRQEAMKRYTTVLDNLVDDWRRIANERNYTNENNNSFETDHVIADQQTSEAGSTTHGQVKRSNSMFDRLPRIYDELMELQERVEVETKKRVELEDHLLHLTRDYRSSLKEELEQMGQIRKNLVSLVKNLEDDVVQHKSELQRLTSNQQKLAFRNDNSVLLLLEARALKFLQIWVRSRTIRASLAVLIGLRLWYCLRNRRLPQFLAHILIRWIQKFASLDNTNTYA
ncbi:putative acyl-CoA-binding protein, ACBP [Plasmopara halstedii]